MKKLALTILISTLISGSIIAQDSTTAQETKAKSEEPGLHFGLKLTPTFNWFTVDRNEFESDGAYIGYTYGLMMDFKLARNYFLATGVEISQRGGKLKSDALATETGLGGSPIKIGGTITQRLQYVDIPLALKLKTNDIGYIQYYGHFGFLMGFMIKANQDVDFDDNSYGYEDKNKRNNQSDFGFFNFGLNVGLGLEYNIAGNTDITVGVGYQNGFVDIWSEDKAKITNNSITLNFGVFF
jgi:opacity protein-like surface antigen